MKSILPPFILLSIINAAFCQTYETKISRRERNLDHIDAETLAAYLGLDSDTAKPLEEDKYVGYDTAIMFYAQWCTNCHKFATVWDTIGQLVHAGTTESNLIMALFNCELNQHHTKLCDAAGVTHYPTLMYVGAGKYQDTDPISSAVMGSKAAGPYGPTKLPRTVKFQGNLNVGDSVLDWIKAMRGLSTWNKWNYMDGGWLRGVRQLFKNPLKKKVEAETKNALPVGVPTGVSGSGAKSATSNYYLERELKTAEENLVSAKKDLEEAKMTTNHAGYLIDSFLFPVATNESDDDGKSTEVPVDVFQKMKELDAWGLTLADSASNEEEAIVKSCVVDLTLDFCTRFSSKATTDYLASISDLSTEEYPTFTTMEKELLALIEEREPYCAKFNDCYKNGFKESEGCRPETCPFKNDAACRYLTGCMSEHIQKEYKDVLEKAAKAESSESKTKTSTSDTTSAKVDDSKPSGGWGIKK